MPKTFYILFFLLIIFCSGCGDEGGSTLAPYMMQPYIPNGNGTGDLVGMVKSSHTLGVRTDYQPETPAAGGEDDDPGNIGGDAGNSGDDGGDMPAAAPFRVSQYAAADPSEEETVNTCIGYAIIDEKVAYFNNDKFYINNIPIGFHNITIYAYGFPPFEGRVEILEDQHNSFTFYLIKKTEDIVDHQKEMILEPDSTYVEFKNIDFPQPNYYKDIVTIFKEANVTYLNIVRFTKKPILVYLDKKNVPADWTNTYATQVVNAFGVWEEACEELEFELIEERSRSDISVQWISAFAEDNVLGATYPIDPAYPDYPGYKVLIQLPVNDSAEDLKLSTAIHEVGHALGLHGHSESETDIMYPADVRLPFDGTPQTELSQADINTINILYKIIPTWTNIASSQSRIKVNNLRKPTIGVIQ